MGREKIAAAQRAARPPSTRSLDGVWFAVIAGSHQAQLAYPARRGSAMVRMDRARPAQRPRPRSTGFRADGGTAMGTWLQLATRLFARCRARPSGTPSCSPTARTSTRRPSSCTPRSRPSRGQFQCDCRGVGADWEVDELRRIATALLGTVDIVAEPGRDGGRLRADDAAAMGRGVADAALRVWAPQGAEVLFVRQVAPHRRGPHVAAPGDQPADRRVPDRRVGRRVPRLPRRRAGAGKAVGQEQLAARVAAGGRRRGVAQGLVKALWSDDEALTTRINPEVAHYTGQAELAEAIQEGLAAKAAGDDDTATAKLGRAVQLAARDRQRRGHDPAAQGRRRRRRRHRNGPPQA